MTIKTIAWYWQKLPVLKKTRIFVPLKGTMLCITLDENEVSSIVTDQEGNLAPASVKFINSLIKNVVKDYGKEQSKN